MSTSFSFLLGLVGVAIVMDIYFLIKVYESSKMAKLYSESGIRYHKKSVYIFLGCIFLSVCLIEGMIKLKYGWEGVVHLLDTPLGIFHALLDLFFSLTIIDMVFFRTGLKNPTMHRKLFKRVVGSFILIFVSGSWLTLELVSRV